MRVLSVATSDRGGGAEQIAWDVFMGLEARGHDSWLAVGRKHSSHPRVFEIHASPWFDYRPYDYRFLQAYWNGIHHWRRFWGLEDFTHPFSRRLIELLPEPPDAVIAHNLHGGYFDLRALPLIAAQAPLLAVLHDFWMLTGHCAYPLDCERWKHGCGHCPHLETPPAIRRDASRTNLKLKRSIYSAANFTVCSPSRRLLSDVEKSVLGQAGRLCHSHIPNGVDLEIFRPGDASLARARLGLPQNTPLVLLAGVNIEKNPFKDFACALACVSLLAAEGRTVTFVVLGAEKVWVKDVGGIRIQHVPFVSDRSCVADYFRACDVFLHATRDEVAPLVLSEALASGLPVVASDVGNAKDLLGDAGILVPRGDAQAHAIAVGNLLDNHQLRCELEIRSRNRAEAGGGLDQMIGSYEKWLLGSAMHCKDLETTSLQV